MNEESKHHKNLDELDSEKNIDLNCFDSFNNILVHSVEANEFIEKLKDYVKEYFTLNSNLYNNMNELYYNFSKEKCGHIFINTPIFKIESIIKKMFQIQLKNCELIITKGDLFYLIGDKLIKLQKIIKESSSNYNSFLENKDIYIEINNAFNAMRNIMNNLEIKSVDEYIWKKYKKHSEETVEKSVEDLVMDIKKLEKSIHHLFEEKKFKYYLTFKEPNEEIQDIYQEIKRYSINYAENLKAMNINLDNELKNIENEINSKVKIENEKDNNKKSGLNIDENEFYSIKYKIKILKSNKIRLKITENERKSQKITKENQNKAKTIKEEKKELFNQKVLYLTDKDKYEIISKLYSFNLKIIQWRR